MDALLLLDQVRQNSKFVCCEYVIFSTQNQTQTMKIMRSDSSHWNFLQMSKRWKLDKWGRREWKIIDKAFFCIWAVGDQSGCCTCGNKVDIITWHVIETNLLNLIGSYSLTLICIMNFGNANISHGYILYWKVKTGKMVGFWWLFLKNY